MVEMGQINSDTNFQEALAKLQKYCSYQERCLQEVKRKLLAIGATANVAGQIIDSLIEEGYLNEERFAKSFARGRFRYKKWGRIRIEMELGRRQVKDVYIISALDSIDENSYLETLTELIRKKNNQVKAPDIYSRRKKIADYMVRKGYEPEIVWKELKEKLLS